MDEKNLRAAITAHRTDLADVLSDLSAEQWDTPSLCQGWRTREVVAHLTMAFRFSVPRFLREMARSRGDFHRMADRVARADGAAMSAAELAAAVRDNVAHPWKPPGGGFHGALTHDVVHGLDFSVPLGLTRKIPEPPLRDVLDGLAANDYFGVDLTGVELRAEDLDWSHGTGAPLVAPATDLVLVMAGRKLPPGRLTGDPAPRFEA